MLKTIPLKSKFYGPLNYLQAVHFYKFSHILFHGKHKCEHEILQETNVMGLYNLLVNS